MRFTCFSSYELSRIIQSYAKGKINGDQDEQFYIDQLSLLVDNDERIPKHLKTTYKINYVTRFKNKVNELEGVRQ